MRTILKLLVSIIGVAAIVFGIVFIFQSGPAKKQVADNIAPITLSQLNATYNTVTANLDNGYASRGAKYSGRQSSTQCHISLLDSTASRVRTRQIKCWNCQHGFDDGNC